jgi:hypothetical protein
MRKFRPRHTVRHRQKMSYRMIVSVSMFCIALVATGLVVLINIIHVEKSMAQQAAQFTIEDGTLINDKSLPTIITKQHPSFGPQTQFVRKAKAVKATETNISE